MGVNWVDFLARNRTASDSRTPPRRGSPTIQHTKNPYIEDYLYRLGQFLGVQLEAGNIQQSDIKQIYDIVNEQLATLPPTKDPQEMRDAFNTLEFLPYDKELFGTDTQPIERWQWSKVLQDMRNEYQKANVELEATKRSYLPQFKQYLDKAVRSGGITQEQAAQYYKAEESQIEIGIAPKNLVNYQGVQDWVKSQETTGKQTAGQKAGAEFEKAWGGTPQYDQKRGERRVAMEAAFGLRPPLTPKAEETPDMDLLQAQTEQRNLGLSYASDQQVAQRASRAQLFEAFEAKRVRDLSRLDPEADWIQRWFRGHELNPYTLPETTAQDRMDALTGELSKWESIAQNYPDTPVNVGGQQTWGDVADQSMALINQTLTALRNQPPEDDPALSSVLTPSAPPTPDWLAELVPELKAGQPIRQNVTIPTPSGQQWTQLAPSTMTRFAGFTGWAGTPIKDILARMEQMRPRTPGWAGRSQWTPQRQF